MNILMIGTGKGSFEVRGKQLGGALGARVAQFPFDTDLTWADVVVLIKHAGTKWAERVREAKKPIVWDALDFWSQPEQNHYTEDEALRELRKHVRFIQPALTIGATMAMAEACGGAYLPHHARPGLVPLPVRENVQVVAYEGMKKLLGKWAQIIQHECDRRGWAFAINPPSIAEADIIVAFRDGKWDGWMSKNWKSGVKYVNALAVCRPVISQSSAAWNEIQPVGTTIEYPEDLAAIFNAWAPKEARKWGTTGHEFDGRFIVDQYKRLLEKVA